MVVVVLDEDIDVLLEFVDRCCLGLEEAASEFTRRATIPSLNVIWQEHLFLRLGERKADCAFVPVRN